MEVMAPDGGGLVVAALAPIQGAELVATLLARANRVAAAFESLVVGDGRVTRIYAMRNPRKLTRLDEPAELAR
jgi:hypothetical protein